MTLEPLYLDIGVQNTYVFSLDLFLAKFTSAVSATVVMLLMLKVVLEKTVLKRPGNIQHLYSCRSFAPEKLHL